MPPKRAQIGKRGPSGDDDRSRADGSSSRRDLDHLASRANATHCRALEDRRAAIGGSRGKAKAGAKRIERKPAGADCGAALDRGFT